ncbi:hypothetical protein HXX76_012913 [Chlamydomonas incerta]|uniref:WD repeat-containing protein 75 second beta-propeller domain-containing protein n=1 Tax=Chlamydomonas incerta TaxID=51695 RepID=A0A835VRJ9_CHLIN|nr:hypothetical protein HXX76_012913 [Chlamydomonas incerta]|eukprot:KAG2426597.1 hypothetical protein HXX76_012913 [Chlamydomonas incerta]
MDATVRLWDYRSGEELSRVTAREPVKYMVIHKGLGVAYLSMQLREGGGRVVLYNIRTGKFSGTAMKTRLAGPLALSPGGGLAATIDRHSLFVWRTGTDIYQPLNLHHTKPYTCLAISADDSLIAAGDASGRILIWRAFEHSVPSGLRSENSGKAHPTVQPPLTTLHWHAHPVGCLTFSPDGTYLLSGGSEGVLVQWALETNRPGFLPRLGGALLGLHPSPADPARYLVRQADNVVRLVNVATMKVECSVQGLRPPPAGLLPPAGVAGGAAALLPPGASAGGVGGGAGGGGVLVVPAENAALQFYDVGRDRHMQLVQVAPRNAVSMSDTSTSGRHGAGAHPHPHGQHPHHQHPNPHQQHPHAHASHGGPQQPGQAATSGSGPGSETPAPPFVSLLAFSRDASVMATVDLRPDAGPYGSTEACLRFWDAGSSGPGSEASTSGSGSGFALNTRVDEPHRDLVTALVYHPTRDLAVTTGGSGSESEFKVWIQDRRAAAPASGSGSRRAGAPPSTHWRCRSTGGYKGLPLGAAAFSADGSVLAVAAGSRVTLWDADSNALAAALPAAVPTTSAAAAAPPLTSLAFVPGTPFLAAASPSCVAVYNLLTAAVHWCLPYGAVSITADAAYGLLAAALPAPPPPAAAAAPAAADAAAGGEEAAAPEDQEAAGAGPASTAAAAAAAAQRRRQAARAAHGAAAAAGCHVLVFDPRDATPKYHCHVPGASHVHLAALPAAAAAAGGGCSPLLILRDNRQYSVAAVPGSSISTAAAGEDAAAAGPIPKEETLSVFEATFGKVAGGAGAGGVAAMDVDGGAGVSGKARWAELFDAPSHVLPPPTALAHAFLTLLTTAPDS